MIVESPSVRVQVTVPSLLLHPDRPHVLRLEVGEAEVDQLAERVEEAEWETGRKLGDGKQ